MQKINCDSVLDLVPFFVSHMSPTPNDSMKMDLEIFNKCGVLDSVDREMFKGPVLATVIIKFVNQKKVMTYRSIINAINAFKKTDDYPMFRESTIIQKTLENKTININEWDKDKLLFIKMGASEENLKEFKQFLSKIESPDLTYKQAFEKYSAYKDQSKVAVKEKLKFEELIDLKSSLKAGKKANKKVLIYFASSFSTLALKMEESMLTDPDIKSMISKNFVYYAGDVDNKKNDGTKKTTIGAKHAKLQSKKFKSYQQPFFVLLSPKGKIIASIGYTDKKEEFVQFFNKGLN